MKKVLITITAISAFMGAIAISPNETLAAPATFKTVPGQRFCGYLQGGASAGGACDTAIHTGDYRGAGLGANLCRILNCTY